MIAAGMMSVMETDFRWTSSGWALTGNLEARDISLVGERKTEALGIVVDVLHALELQVDKALVTPLESLVSGGFDGTHD